MSQNEPIHLLTESFSTSHSIIRPTPLRAIKTPISASLSSTVKYEQITPERDNSTQKTNNNSFVTNLMIGKVSTCAEADYQILDETDDFGNCKIENEFSKTLGSASRLYDVKAAIEQIRSSKSKSSSASSTSSSSTSSSSTSPSSCVSSLTPKVSSLSHSSPTLKTSKSQKIIKSSSNLTITSAEDEFVWIDSQHRLVELINLPWNQEDLCSALPKRNDEEEENSVRMSLDLLPRLSYYLSRLLVRIAIEVQRLSRPLGKCGKDEILAGLKIILPSSLASQVSKACLRSVAMFNISGDALRQSKSARSGLHLKIGKMHQWMCSVKLGKFVSEFAAIYLTAALEAFLEELLLYCYSLQRPDKTKGGRLLSASLFETAVMNNGDFWGLFQSNSHLALRRLSSGALSPPHSPALSSSFHSSICKAGKTLEQIMCITCVGSPLELEELVNVLINYFGKTGLTKGFLTPSSCSITTLYYFMRCSQLESVGAEDEKAPTQELLTERPIVVLPPLLEWIRVVSVFCEYRKSVIFDENDVLQAARVLLPGMDIPIRSPIHYTSSTSHYESNDESQYVHDIKLEMGFRMLLSGRKDLIPHALQYFPLDDKLNASNGLGFTLLQIASIKGHVDVIKLLIETGADVDGHTTNKMTPLCYASLLGQSRVVRLLLDFGARIEGLGTETPLQLAAGSGQLKVVEILLSYGASPFFSESGEESLLSMSSESSVSAVSLAAMNGHRRVLQSMITHALTSPSIETNEDEVLSLYEILTEDSSFGLRENESRDSKGILHTLSKAHIKKLQEAMYHASENRHLDLTLDLRNLGVPWLLHTWLLSLSASLESPASSCIDELLQDFYSEWPNEDKTSFFVDEGLKLLFCLFRSLKSESTLLLLADIFSICYGVEPIASIVPPSHEDSSPRIDSAFVNNPELSDVQFRVEGRVFYAHKLVLLTASTRFKSMLQSRYAEGFPPVLQINDIRYDIFYIVMKYLYHGGCESLQVSSGDILELMAAANFFQLPGLLKYCESRSFKLIDLDSIVSYYIHSKVYSAFQLLEYCEGFILQNFVSLLTYDDSVKRLIFGKKLMAHDVLSGLLSTLQKRMRSKNNSV